MLVNPLEGAETFFVSDGRDLSLPTLIRMIGEALGKRARLFPVPPSMLRLGAAGRGGRAPDRLAYGGRLQALPHDRIPCSAFGGGRPACHRRLVPLDEAREVR